MNIVVGTKTTGAVIYDDSEAYEVDTNHEVNGVTFTRYENTTLPQHIKIVDATGDTTITTRVIGVWSNRANLGNWSST